MQERELYSSVNLTQGLTDVFTTVGETAYKAGIPICFFIDEIQYMKPKELGSLISALHRTNQLGYPVMEIGSLTDEQSRNAIAIPAQKFGVTYTDEAIDKIISITKGYPFFIQQMCQVVYKNAGEKEIDCSLVENSAEEFYKLLDVGFFKVRYERCADGDRKFIFAMVQCGELPCTVANVAKNLNKNVNSVSTTRAQLISKGIIYPIRYRELDFTVPEFSGYIQRLEEYRAWCKDKE